MVARFASVMEEGIGQMNLDTTPAKHKIHLLG